MGIIYKATNKVTGKSYIGQSKTTLCRRLSSHKYSCLTSKKKTIFYDAIRSYGWDAFDWKVILVCEDADLDYYEIETISCYKTLDRDFGYNDDGGGNVGKYRNPSNWSGEKNGNYGKSPNENQKRGLELGREWQRDNRDIVSNNFRKLWSDPNYAERMKNRKTKTCRKWVLLKDSIEIVVENMSKFCKDNNLNKSMFYHILNGKIKSYKGYSVKE